MVGWVTTKSLHHRCQKKEGSAAADPGGAETGLEGLLQAKVAMRPLLAPYPVTNSS